MTPEEAQEAWRKKAKEVIPDPPEGLRTGTLEFHIEKKRESYIQGIDNFKSSLRKMIEERITELENKPESEGVQYALSELKRASKLLDTCKP